jgi:hypothetical protein
MHTDLAAVYILFFAGSLHLEADLEQTCLRLLRLMRLAAREYPKLWSFQHCHNLCVNRSGTVFWKWG